MIPILTRYGSSFLYSFTVVIGLGLVTGFGLAAWLARRQRPSWVHGWLAAMVGGWIGGRLLFVALNAHYYQTRPSTLLNLWQGGLTFHGVAAGALLGLGWWQWRTRQTFALTARTLAPAAAWVMAFGWAACWLEGCAYGRETTIGLLAADLPDALGVYALRYQVQLVGMVLSLAVFTAVWWGRNRLTAVALFWSTLLALSLIQFLLTFWRGDPVPVWGDLRLDTLANLVLVLICLILLQYTRIKTQTKDGA